MSCAKVLLVLRRELGGLFSARVPHAWFALCVGFVCLVAYWYLSGFSTTGTRLPAAFIAGVLVTFICLALVPWVLSWLLALDRRALGISLGDVRFGITATIALALVALPATVLLAMQPAVSRSFPLTGQWPLESAATLFAWALLTLLYAFSIELFHRGFLLTCLSREWGRTCAIWVQAFAFALAHLGNPLLVVLGALPLGLALGVLAARSRSLAWSTLLFWTLLLVRDVVALHANGLLGG